MRWSTAPVLAQSRMMLPVLEGISGSHKTMCSIATRGKEARIELPYRLDPLPAYGWGAVWLACQWHGQGHAWLFADPPRDVGLGREVFRHQDVARIQDPLAAVTDLDL